MVGKLILVILAGIVAFAAYVRLAPSDPARWHVVPEPVPERFRGGLVAVWPGDQSRFERLDAIIRATPRTKLLAGSTGEGGITYVTRSRLWGFPDYTSVHLTQDARITIFARLRFGRSDMGVNAARVADWQKRLEAVEGG